MSSRQPLNALIIAPQWLGDAVMTEPLLRRLAARGERLTVAALASIAPIYRLMPLVHEVIELPFPRGGLQLKARWALAQQLRDQFDVAYVCPNSLKSALLPLMARIPRRVGYTGEMRFGLLSDRLDNPAPGERPPMVEWYTALSLVGQPEHQPLKLEGDLRPVLAAGVGVLHVALKSVTDTMPNLPTLRKHSYVVFAPGAEYGPAKRWPARHFGELASKIDLPVLLLGTQKEFDICQEIATLANANKPPHCFNLAGRTNLTQAISLIASAHRMVSNDSGLMHVAAAFGVPQVAIYGSSSPEHTPPLNALARVVWLRTDPDYHPPLACSPCYKRTCPLGHTRCLEDISAARVHRLL